LPLALLLGASCLFGQENARLSSQTAGVTITASGQAGDRVRITAPSSIVQMRVEIYAPSAQKVWDSDFRGNVFDWLLQDGQAQRLSAGDYACVVTVKNVAGRMTQRMGSITVGEQGAIVRSADAAQLTSPQSQAIGPLEENASWVTLTEDQNQTTTIIAHDGTDGQIVRGRGAISFRLGDFFSGKDIEQMRLTEAGNLGIGTAKPKFKLDVLGAIRAREGFVFNNGSTLNVNDKGSLSLTNADGSITPNIAGSGTQNKLAKWTDNSGTLGDSTVTELNGNLGVGTSSPSAKFHLHAGAGQAADVRMTNDSISSPFTFGGALPNNLGARFTFATVLEGGFAAQGFTDANSPAFRFQGHIGSTSPTQIPVIFEGFKSNGAGDRAPLGATEKVFGFYNGAFDAGGTVMMAMTGNGDVGIGTTSPSNTLDVVGPIRSFNLGSTDVIAQTNSPGANAWARMTIQTLSQRWALGTSQNFNGNELYIYDYSHDQMRMGIQPSGGVVSFSNFIGGGHLLMGEAGCGGGYAGIGFGATLSNCVNYSLIGNGIHTLLSRPAGGGLFFREANNDQMMIAAGGNVGIGTTTPTLAKLQVQASGGGTIGIYGQGGSGASQGVYGKGHYGVFGTTTDSTTSGVGVYGECPTGDCYAGYFAGDAKVTLALYVGTNPDVQISNGVVVADRFDERSDRNLKANFASVDARAILHRLAAIPIQSWNFKSDAEQVRHIGPMAQDFSAAFNLGTDDKHIATVDADGVALAAIQGLYQLVQEKEKQIERLQSRVRRLERRGNSRKH